MGPRGQWLLVTLAGIGLALAVGCDRVAPGGGTGAAKSAKPSTAPTTQPESGNLSAIQRMVADSGGSSGASSEMPVLPPGHPPVPGMPMPPAAQTPSLPAGHPPLNPTASMPSVVDAMGTSIPLKWDDPTDWKPARPATTFRLAQYEIPAAEGEAPGAVAVFHFPGSGGSVEDNVARWVGQFSDADGKAIDPASVKQETFEANGLKVHFVEVSGYMMVSKAMGGTGQRSPDQYRLLGGIVEMPDGNWFFKGTGPEKTMAGAREAFLRMLRSVHEGEATAKTP
jgi:hypothetical protein